MGAHQGELTGLLFTHMLSTHEQKRFEEFKARLLPVEEAVRSFI